jgi:hypothetical protein
MIGLALGASKKSKPPLPPKGRDALSPQPFRQNQLDFDASALTATEVKEFYNLGSVTVTKH